jgi:hypothetical protein
VAEIHCSASSSHHTVDTQQTDHDDHSDKDAYEDDLDDDTFEDALLYLEDDSMHFLDEEDTETGDRGSTSWQERTQ